MSTVTALEKVFITEDKLLFNSHSHLQSNSFAQEKVSALVCLLFVLSGAHYDNLLVLIIAVRSVNVTYYSCFLYELGFYLSVK